jgi:putative ABC transport system permease protein
VNAGEVLRSAVAGLAANKLRSALTTLGIMIGVGAVILLVAVGNGSSKAVQASLQRLGTNSLTVLHTTSGGFGPFASTTNKAPKDLTVADAQALTNKAGAPDVKSASPVVTASETLTYQGASHTVSQFTGTYPSYFEASNSPVTEGTYFTNSDVLNARKVMVIGTTVRKDLFGNLDPIGKKVNVGGVPFTVVGLLKHKGSSGFQDADDIAIAPLSTVQQSLTGYGTLNSILVEAASPTTVNGAQSQVTAILDQRHGVTSTDADFQILNQASLLSTSSSTSHTFTVLLGAVAAISLLVGGIGITNIMLVTVTERTREIGIRKAIGAPKGAILGQFLAEATLLSVIGGLFGVIAGLIGSRFTIVGVKPVIVPSSILLAFGVSVVIGLFFGGYPANRAASLRPIEALRYE